VINSALLLVRLVLTAVFLVAGLAKLRDLPGSRQAVRDFGLPGALASPLGVLLPLVELTVAIALLPTTSAWYGSLGALVLLLAFIAGIALNMAKGRAPDCHCFGQLHSEPVGWPTLARNAVLAVLAAFVLVQGPARPGPSAVAWLSRLTPFETIVLAVAVVGFALLALQGWAILHLLQQNGRILRRLDALEGAPAEGQQPAPAVPALGLPVGTVAPAFALPDLEGHTISLDDLRAAGQPVVLLFTSPGCGPCATLLPEVARWQQAGDRLTVALVATGTAEQNGAKAAEHGLRNVLLQREKEVAEAYRSPGTPSAVIVGADGRIAQPMAAGPEPIRALVNRQLEAPPPLPTAASSPNGHAAGAAIRSPAPAFSLPDLQGRQVTLADLRGHETLLLFWNTGCGFCRQILDDLKAWEAKRPAHAPQIVVFSSGPLEEIRAMGLRSTVIPDPSFSHGPRFGANGTPMAVLLDGESRVASAVVAGGPAVLALARGEKPAAGGQLVALQDRAPRPNGTGSRPSGATIGDPAPDFSLPDLEGKTVSLSDFRGHPTLVLFWNTGCGFCQQMLPDLKTWEGARTASSPQLLVVSPGSVDDNRAMGLRSPVLIDATFSVGSRYGAAGTPMAVLVDAEGRIASEMAAGAPAVLALLDGGAVPGV
jgi:peroxiredoxin/uncharacterized membrane protein YphA (DoxX/SURF4 family)